MASLLFLSILGHLVITTAIMNFNKTVIKLLLGFVALIPTALMGGDMAKVNQVVVIINSGSEVPVYSAPVEWNSGLTALEALQNVAEVSTHPRGRFVFVNSINGIKNQRAVKAWYYTVNGEPTGTLSINYKVNPGDTIKWIFREETCSPR